jgi:hypothetical protein
MDDKPKDLMPLDEALAIVLTYGQRGSPWLIGPESAVLDRAKRTVSYFAKTALAREASPT